MNSYHLQLTAQVKCIYSNRFQFTLKTEKMQHSLKGRLRGDTEEKAGWFQSELQSGVVLSHRSELLTE